MSLMVSISGIRGIIGQSLTPDVAVRYAAAFAAYCRHQRGGPPSIVLGRDGRITGKTLADTIATTLIAAGANVRDLGICPTPTVQLAVERTQADGGIAVTASHNPIEWNGMKFMAPTGMFLDAEENAAFWQMADQPPVYAPWNRQGSLTSDTTWIRKHIDAVLTLDILDPDTIRRRRLSVVLDCVNAAGGIIVPTLLRELGCEVVEMNCDVSGVFGHTPEPVPENLTDLTAQVRASRADLGIAVDPDGDRLVLITELGEPYGEEYTVASAIKFVLDRQQSRGRPAAGGPPTVVVNLSTTRAVDDIARSHGAQVLRTPVGEINVAKKMKSVGAVAGGEGSGGVILPAVHLGRDAIVGIGLILQLIAESGQPVSHLKATLPPYSITKGKIPLGSSSPDDVLEEIGRAHRDEGRVNTDDGVKIDFPDSWVHLRKSNTEPIMRIIAEARTAEEAREVVRRFTEEIRRLIG